MRTLPIGPVRKFMMVVGTLWAAFIVGLFYPGPMKGRWKAAGFSLGLSFCISFLWLTADDVAFRVCHPPHEEESFQRDRWWPYRATMTKVWDEDYGAMYWAL